MRTAQRKPRYIAIVAVTLDGKIATHEKQFTNWTSKEDKKFMRAFLDASDVVIVGRNTYETAKKPLSKRNCIVLTRSVRGIVQKKPNLVFINPHTKRASHSARKENNARSGVGVNPQKTAIAEYIKERRYKTIAILGGTQTYTYFLEHKLIDELYLTIEPVIFGNGLPIFNGKITRQTARIISIKKLNKTGTVLIHARL